MPRCVICERGLAGGVSTHIDHWRPLSVNPELALTWKNLYLSCAAKESCDVAKSDRPLRWHPEGRELPWPCECAYEEVIGFSHDGEIYFRSDSDLDESLLHSLAVTLHDHTIGTLKQPGILRLNSRPLIEAWKAAMDSQKVRVERHFKDRHASQDERRRIADELLKTDTLPQFVSIRVAYLRKTLGNGK